MPKYELEQIEDIYTLYVEIIGVSEDLFWKAPISFVKTVALNKQAYNQWISAEKARILEGK